MSFKTPVSPMYNYVVITRTCKNEILDALDVNRCWRSTTHESVRALRGLGLEAAIKARAIRDFVMPRSHTKTRLPRTWSSIEAVRTTSDLPTNPRHRLQPQRCRSSPERSRTSSSSCVCSTPTYVCPETTGPREVEFEMRPRRKRDGICVDREYTRDMGQCANAYTTG